MNRVCYDINDFDDILTDLRDVLARLDNNLIGDALLWI